MVLPDDISPQRVDEIVASLAKGRTPRPLAHLGALRYVAHLKGITLADLVGSVRSATSQTMARKALEDSKPYMDILAIVGLTGIPDEAFSAISRPEARQLARTLQPLKRRPLVIEQLRNYLSTDCRFGTGWVVEVIDFLSRK